MSFSDRFYNRTVGRFSVSMNGYAFATPDYQCGGSLEIRKTNHLPRDAVFQSDVSLEDLRELHYLTGRAIARVEEEEHKRRSQ